MIEVKKIQLKGHHFLGVYVNLPQYPIHFILSTHTILAQDAFSLAHFEKKDAQIAVILCAYQFGFDGLLASVVVAKNDIAKHLGVIDGMNAREALLLCEDHKKEKED